MSDSTAVAIVGMACRLPGARDVGAYWHNLRDGVESISRFDVDQLIAAGLDPDLVRQPGYVGARGVIAGGERFDHAFFGYSRAEAAGMDAQHRVFLETSSAALDDAGIDPQRFGGWIGVFAGCSTVNPQVPDYGGDEVAWLLGYEKDFFASRVAYKLGLRGPAITLQTACSTSLVAVHQAAQSLLGYECDAALAGGASLWVPQTTGYLYEEGSIMSVDGRCRPFDAAASGTVGGNGVGAVVLRRLDDALRDGDRIVAVIRGSATNNDGAEKIGYIAPSVVGQREVIQLALAQAGVDAADIGYVEAHGTGTKVGDPVEVAALTAAFRESTERTGYCWLGAVKSNIGHTGSAAGVSGLIKTALMLRHRELVPSLHFERPNPGLELDTSPFRVIADRRPWQADGPLLAGISSFGMGGTNAHAVLESPPTVERRAARSGPKVFCLSAATPAALRRAKDDLAEHLSATAQAADPPPLEDVAWTLATGRRRFAHRGAVVASTRDEAATALRTDTPPVRAAGDPVAFLFPGQGALRTGFGGAAHRLLPTFRSVFDDLGADARERFGIDLEVVLRRDADPAWLRDTAHQQLGLFALGYALARQFQDFGIEPAAMLGHSVGEYVAATVSGLWSPADALALIHERGRALRDTAPGRMLVVGGPPEDVRTLLTGRPGLTVAVDAPGYVVLAGSPEDIEAVRADGVGDRLVDTERAFHSPLVRSAAEQLGRVVAATPTAAPRRPFLSNLTGGWAEPDRVAGAAYWVDHLSGTVRLNACLDTLLAGRCRVFLELGPGRGMSRMLRGHRLWRPEHVAVPVAGRGDDPDEAGLLTALARLWELGFDVDIEELLAQAGPRLTALPPYPFEPTDCTPTRHAPAPVATAPRQPEPGGPRGERAGLPPDAIEPAVAEIWCELLGVDSASADDDFYDVGGESLTSIFLVGHIRDRLGISVSVTTFTTRPTFGHLLELVAQARPRVVTAAAARVASPADLLVLRESGTRPPLFLAAPAAGSSLVYRRLARELGPDQPCYGLESPGLHDRTSPARRFEDIAAHHVDLLRQVRPHGPYVLGGWSVGAMVAHEMARQLCAQGETVTKVIGVDACVIDTWGWPMAADLGFLGRALRLLARTRWQRFRGADSADGWQAGGFEDTARDIAGVDGALNFFDVFNANITAMLRYRPRPVPCPIVTFPTSPRPGQVERLRRRVAPLYRSTTIVPVPGNHWTILGRHVATLAEDIRAALATDDEPMAATAHRAS